MTLLAAMGVGLCWGATNACLRPGVLRAVSRKDASTLALARLVGSHWAALLATPAFVVPQLLNWAASAALVTALAGSRLHVTTPVANAISIAANAITAKVAFGEDLSARLVAAGSALIVVGTALTGA